MKGRRTFLAKGRNKYFAIIARDTVSGLFDVTESACLPRLTLGTRRSLRTDGTRFAALSCYPLRTGGSLLPRASQVRQGFEGRRHRARQQDREDGVGRPSVCSGPVFVAGPLAPGDPTAWLGM